MTFPEWDGYTPYEQHAAFTVPTAAWPAQIIPNTIFSGIAYRFPQVEMGIRRDRYRRGELRPDRLRSRVGETAAMAPWIDQRPSEMIRQQVYVNFWYEQAGIGFRHEVGVDNIMWESDYPHIASTYPDRGSSSNGHCRASAMTSAKRCCISMRSRSIGLSKVNEPTTTILSAVKYLVLSTQLMMSW